VTLPGATQFSLHTVQRRHAWLWLDGPTQAECRLPGDLALVVGGRDHHIADDQAHDVVSLTSRDLTQTAPGQMPSLPRAALATDPAPARSAAHTDSDIIPAGCDTSHLWPVHPVRAMLAPGYSS